MKDNISINFPVYMHKRGVIKLRSIIQNTDWRVKELDNMSNDMEYINLITARYNDISKGEKSVNIIFSPLDKEGVMDCKDRYAIISYNSSVNVILPTHVGYAEHIKSQDVQQLFSCIKLLLLHTGYKIDNICEENCDLMLKDPNISLTKKDIDVIINYLNDANLLQIITILEMQNIDFMSGFNLQIKTPYTISNAKGVFKIASDCLDNIKSFINNDSIFNNTVDSIIEKYKLRDDKKTDDPDDVKLNNIIKQVFSDVDVVMHKDSETITISSPEKNNKQFLWNTGQVFKPFKNMNLNTNLTGFIISDITIIRTDNKVNIFKNGSFSRIRNITLNSDKVVDVKFSDVVKINANEETSFSQCKFNDCIIMFNESSKCNSSLFSKCRINFSSDDFSNINNNSFIDCKIITCTKDAKMKFKKESRNNISGNCLVGFKKIHIDQEEEL